MAAIRIVTDSGSDLPPKLASELKIDVVPLTVRFGAEEFRELSPEDFWRRLSNSPVLPETAAPSPGAFEEAFRKAGAEGADGVVCVTLSGGLSATYQSAVVAAQSVAADIPVRVVDSRNVTIAEGLMAVAAARLAQQGKGLDDCAGAAEDLATRTKVYGALDTLENLKKGGRIGSAQAFLGSMLSIKPIIQVIDGKVEPESKQRTRSKSLRYLVEKVREAGHIEDLAVMHGDAPDVDELLDLLGAVYPRDDIIVGDVGPVIGTHAGPRVVGVSFHLPRA
jgi:DegV family protein with EDD domain